MNDLDDILDRLSNPENIKNAGALRDRPMDRFGATQFRADILGKGADLQVEQWTPLNSKFPQTGVWLDLDVTEVAQGKAELGQQRLLLRHVAILACSVPRGGVIGRPTVRVLVSKARGLYRLNPPNGAHGRHCSWRTCCLVCTAVPSHQPRMRCCWSPVSPSHEGLLLSARLSRHRRQAWHVQGALRAHAAGHKNGHASQRQGTAP